MESVIFQYTRKCNIKKHDVNILVPVLQTELRLSL